MRGFIIGGLLSLWLLGLTTQALADHGEAGVWGEDAVETCVLQWARVTHSPPITAWRVYVKRRGEAYSDTPALQIPGGRRTVPCHTIGVVEPGSYDIEVRGLAAGGELRVFQEISLWKIPPGRSHGGALRGVFALEQRPENQW